MSNNLQNLLEAVLFGVFTVVFVWLYCLATPTQMSAEYDLAVQAEGQAALPNYPHNQHRTN